MNTVRQDDGMARAFLEQAMTGERIVEPFAGLVIERDGAVIGAVVINGWTGRDCHVSGAGRRAFTLGVMRAICRYAFGQLGCARMSAQTRPSNLRARRCLTAAGFQIEGVIRALYDDEDGLLFGMLRQECRVLRGLG